MIEKSDFDFNY